MYYVIRNNTEFGPYTLQELQDAVSRGKILHADIVRPQDLPTQSTVKELFKSNNIKVDIPQNGNLATQLRYIGRDLILPQGIFNHDAWKDDQQLIILALIGLAPLAISILPLSGYLLFYIVSLYFAAIWGLFFYNLFKTKQVDLRTTISIFFIGQALVFLFFMVLEINHFNPFYKLIGTTEYLSLVGCILGIGLTEEVVKMAPLLIILNKAKQPLVPQTLVFYGLISGIAFGVFEGVQYQTSVNSEMNYSEGFFWNIARLTSLPFIHAILCGICGYFCAFANLYPRYRSSLYLLAIAVPAIIHGLYDWIKVTAVCVLLIFGATILLTSYLKRGKYYQQKLR